VSRLSRQCGIVNISQLCRPPRHVAGIALLFFYFIITSFSFSSLLSDYHHFSLPGSSLSCGNALDCCFNGCSDRISAKSPTVVTSALRVFLHSLQTSSSISSIRLPPFPSKSFAVNLQSIHSKLTISILTVSYNNKVQKIVPLLFASCSLLLSSSFINLFLSVSVSDALMSAHLFHRALLHASPTSAFTSPHICPRLHCSPVHVRMSPIVTAIMSASCGGGGRDYNTRPLSSSRH
jgi:hypothetical protein